MNVLIRADAATHIGDGHVMRCISLAKALQAVGAKVTFASKIFDVFTHEKLRAHGLDVMSLVIHDFQSSRVSKLTYKDWLLESQDDDFARMEAAVGSLHFDWLVLDSYSIDRNWERKARGFADRILVIDDLADRPHDCDILLDQNISTGVQDGYANLVGKTAHLLIGPQYCLLRPEFERTKKVAKDRGGLKRLLLFFGGSDQGNLTQSALSTLNVKPLTCLYQLSVLVGTNNKQADAVEHHCREDGIEFNKGVENIAEFIADFDLAIVACGFICYELAAMKVPSLLVPVSDIQHKVATALERAGVAKVVLPNQLSEFETLREKLESIHRIDERSFAGFPKDGARRVAAEMLEFV